MQKKMGRTFWSTDTVICAFPLSSCSRRNRWNTFSHPGGTPSEVVAHAVHALELSGTLRQRLICQHHLWCYALKIILLFGAAFTAADDAVFQLQGECPDNARTNLELVRGLAAFKNTGNGGEVLGPCRYRCVISLP